MSSKSSIAPGFPPPGRCPSSGASKKLHLAGHFVWNFGSMFTRWNNSTYQNKFRHYSTGFSNNIRVEKMVVSFTVYPIDGMKIKCLCTVSMYEICMDKCTYIHEHINIIILNITVYKLKHGSNIIKTFTKNRRIDSETEMYACQAVKPQQNKQITVDNHPWNKINN